MNETVRRAASTVLGVAATAIASYAAFVRWIERRAPRDLAPRPLQALFAAAAGATTIGVTIALLFACGAYEVIARRDAGPAFGVLGVILVAAMLEEITFRGLLSRAWRGGRICGPVAPSVRRIRCSISRW
jgi:hypothetical protein